MSDFGEKVFEALTDEWQTTKEVADSIPMEGRSFDDHDQLTRNHLKSLVRYRMAESRRVKAVYRWVFQWRRKEASE